MDIEFSDHAVKQYHVELREALKIEIQYLNDVTQGVKDLMPDIINRRLTTVSWLIGNIVNMGGSFEFSGVIDTVTQTYIKYRKDRELKEKSDFVFNSKRFKSARTELIFEVIAREAAYRYGSCILNIMSFNRRLLRTNIPDILAKVGAIRIMHYALENDIYNFEQCELIVQGLREGFPKFETHGDYYNTLLANIPLLERVAGKPLVTVEEFYGKSGYALPGSETQFYIDGQHSCCDRIPGVTSLHSINTYIPFYGYAQYSDGHPVPTNLRLHHPPNHPKKDHIYGFQFRYITLLHIEKYLTHCKSTISDVTHRLSFNRWLIRQYPEQFKLPKNVKLTAIFRGTIDGLALLRKGLNFEHGDFSRTDFSHSVFVDVAIGLMKSSFLMLCSFTRVTVQGVALHFSILDLSHFDTCNFTNLDGQLRANYIECTKTKWTFLRTCLYSFIDSKIYDVDYSAEKIETVRVVSSEGQDVKGAEEEKMKIFEGQMRYVMRQVQTSAKLDENSIIRYLQNAVIDLQLKFDAKEAREQQEREKGALVDVTAPSRLPAVHLATLPSAMDGLIMANLVDEAVLKVLEAQYFSKLRVHIAAIVRSNRGIEWYKLSRIFMHRTDGTDGTDGEDGNNGANGAEGGGGGVNGAAGMPAGHGTSAKENRVAIMSLPGQNVFAVTPSGRVETALLPLFDGLVKVILSAMGGKGGKGGRGGKGGDGGDGTAGVDATREGAGTAGTHGGNGGGGGNAGGGGNSGHSETITIHIKETDTDLLMLVELHYSSVPGGVAGLRGLGGLGGKGGRGGRACSYQESYTTYDDKGNSHTNYISKRNPGGADGAPGRMGGDGVEASKGGDGLAGHVDFVVIPCQPGNILSTYNELYNLRFQGCQPIGSDTGIIEPGQVVEIRNIGVHNIGEMGSPAARLMIVVLGNDAFRVDDWSSHLVEESILRNDVAEVESLKITVSHFAIPDYNTVFKLNTAVSLEAHFPRVQRIFAPFSTTLPLKVRYPVELSLVRGPEALVANQKMPISLRIRNISKVDIGRQAMWNRLLWITMETCTGTDVSELNPVFHIPRVAAALPPQDADLPPLPPVHYDEYSLSTPLTYDIDVLGAESFMELQGFLTVSNVPEEWVHNPLSLCFSLTLGDVDRPMHSGSAYIVQRELYGCQLASERTSFTRNDFVLVMNSTTSKAEVEHWRRIATAIDKTLLIWNVSVYKGFSFNYPEFNIMENLEGGIVVLLNTPFKRDDAAVLATGIYEQQAFHPIDYLEESEIFEAARRVGIKVYVVNTDTSRASFDLNERSIPKKVCEIPSVNQFKNRKELLASVTTKPKEHDGKLRPLQREERLAATYEQVTIKNLRLLGEPNNDLLVERTSKMHTVLQKKCPGEDYFYTSSFRSAKVGSSFVLSRYEVGGVEVRRGLDTTYASVAVRNSGDGQAHPLDLDVIVKLMPFSEKLELWAQRPPDSDLQPVLTRQIVSDLIDEQMVYYRHYMTHGGLSIHDLDLGLSIHDLECHLVLLKAFQAFNFFPYLQTYGDLAKDILLDVIVKLRYFASYYPRGVFTNINLKAVVRSTCLQMLERYSSYFGTISVADFKGRRATCRVAMKASDINMAYNKLSDSLDMKVKNITFNHWLTRGLSDYIVFNEVPRTPPAHDLITEVVPADVVDPTADSQAKSLWARYCGYRDKDPAASVYPPAGRAYGSMRSTRPDSDAATGQQVVSNRLKYIGQHPGYECAVDEGNGGAEGGEEIGGADGGEEIGDVEGGEEGGEERSNTKSAEVDVSISDRDDE